MADCNNAVIYITERDRMCHSEKCEDCPLFPDNNGFDMWCDSFEEKHPSESVAAVQRWSDEHPEGRDDRG